MQPFFYFHRECFSSPRLIFRDTPSKGAEHPSSSQEADNNSPASREELNTLAQEINEAREIEIEANRKGWPEELLRFEEYIRSTENEWYEKEKSKSHSWMDSNARFKKILNQKMESHEAQGKWTYGPKAQKEDGGNALSVEDSIADADLTRPESDPPLEEEIVVPKGYKRIKKGAHFGIRDAEGHFPEVDVLERDPEYEEEEESEKNDVITAEEELEKEVEALRPELEKLLEDPSHRKSISLIMIVVLTHPNEYAKNNEALKNVFLSVGLDLKGKRTENLTRAFQEIIGAEVDGWCGKKTAQQAIIFLQSDPSEKKQAEDAEPASVEKQLDQEWAEQKALLDYLIQNHPGLSYTASFEDKQSVSLHFCFKPEQLMGKNNEPMEWNQTGQIKLPRKPDEETTFFLPGMEDSNRLDDFMEAMVEAFKQKVKEPAMAQMEDLLQRFIGDQSRREKIEIGKTGDLDPKIINLIRLHYAPNSLKLEALIGLQTIIQPRLLSGGILGKDPFTIKILRSHEGEIGLEFSKGEMKKPVFYSLESQSSHAHSH